MHPSYFYGALSHYQPTSIPRTNLSWCFIPHLKPVNAECSCTLSNPSSSLGVSCAALPSHEYSLLSSLSFGPIASQHDEALASLDSPSSLGLQTSLTRQDSDLSSLCFGSGQLITRVLTIPLPQEEEGFQEPSVPFDQSWAFRSPPLIFAPNPAHPFPPDSILHLPSSIITTLSEPQNLYDPNTPGSNELIIEIGGRGYLNWNYIKKASVDPYLNRRNTSRRPRTLVIDWRDSPADSGGMFGRIVLKSLFRTLNENIDENGTTHKPITTFNHISISVPQMVKDMGSYDLLGHPSAEDDRVNLRYAINLKELTWRGDIALLFKKFGGISWVDITALDISGCTLSINDAVALVRGCRSLVKASIGTLESNSVLDEPNIVKMPHLCLEHLESLTLASNMPIGLFLDRVKWTDVHRLSLTLRGQALVNALPWLETLQRYPVRNFSLNGSLNADDQTDLFRLFPAVSYTRSNEH